MPHLSVKGAAVLATVGLAVSAAAGCTAGSSNHDASTQPPSAQASGKPSTSGSSVAGATAVPTKVANNVKARKNVQLSSCKKVAGGWGAAGTASNPGTKPAAYTITVFFTSTSATVVGMGKTQVTVDPGSTRSWKVDGQFKAPAKMLCVLRGVG
jgi:hypothetical protein